MFFSHLRNKLLNLGTLMYLKLQKEDCCILRLEHHIMLVQRYGEIILMTTKVIFGVLAVLFTKWLLWSHLSELIQWRRCIIKSNLGNFQGFLTILKIFKTWSEVASKFSPILGQIVIKSWQWLPSIKES